jgi:hypothetical protein
VLKFSRRTTIITMAIVVATSVAAYAFWTGIGSGTGSAQADTGPTTQLTVNQTVFPTGLVPGGPEGEAKGNFINLNTSGVHVNAVKATIDSVTPGPGPNPCTAADFKLTDDTAEVGAVVPPGSPSGSWAGIKIKMLETGVNQDSCKGATVILKYTIV